MKFKIVVLSLLVVMFFSPIFVKKSNAYLALEVTQEANLVEMFMQVLQQIATYEQLVEQYVNMIKRYENMLENSEHWEELFFSEVYDALEELAGVVQDGQVVAYSLKDIDGAYRERYPGYEEYLKIAIPNWDPGKIEEQYLKWAEKSKANVTSALDAASMQNTMFEGEKELIDEFKLQTETPVGRNHILQTGNQIAIEQLAQTKKLRQLIMTQIQFQANHQALLQDKEDARQSIELNKQRDLIQIHNNIYTLNGESY